MPRAGSSSTQKLDVDARGNLPVALGGRGDLVGSYNNTASIVMTVYANWKF